MLTAYHARRLFDILALLMETGLTASKGEGRRLIQQGGIYLEDKRIDDFSRLITTADFKDNKLLIRKGKKIYHLVKISD